MSSETQTPFEAQPIVTLDAVTRRFPGVVANEDVSLEIRPGEVHVLLGENGAGKSTLVGMLSGLIQPDEGRILIEGRHVAIGSPRQALALGIGTVFQHSMLVPSLTVAENLLLGRPWWTRPDRKKLRARVQDLARSLGMRINFDAVASELSLGQQQQVEILRALMRDSRVLILDESTSMLTPSGVEELGGLMRHLVKRGVAIVFITHKLKEAAAFGDRITVLKLGRKVGEIAPHRFRDMSEQTLIAEIVAMMFGERSGDPEGAWHERDALSEGAAPRVAVRGLSLKPTATSPGLADISFDIGKGEILGVAGIDGNGQKQLAEILGGQRACEGGTVMLDGEPIERLSVSARREAGLRYLTDDRLGEGSVGAFPISINLVLKQVGEAPFWKHGIERSGEIDRHGEDLMRRFDIRASSPRTPVGLLSGGNLQKVLLARELTGGASFVVFNKPTHGLDLANTLATRERIRKIAAEGMAVLLISTEIDELVALCDRIAVMAHGRIVGTVENDETARGKIGRLMIGLAA